MRIPAPVEALRAARALLELSQRQAAELVGVSQKSLSVVENKDHLLVDINLALVDVYVARGIEFLGMASVGEQIEDCGVKWAAPSTPDIGREVKASLHAMNVSVSFRAARVFLNKKQTDIASAAGLTVAAIKGLEAGANWTESHQKLVRFFENQDIEFTGWGDPSTGMYYGVGVRWKKQRRS